MMKIYITVFLDASFNLMLTLLKTYIVASDVI